MLCAKFGADDCKSGCKSASYFSTSPQGALGAKKNKPFERNMGCIGATNATWKARNIVFLLTIHQFLYRPRCRNIDWIEHGRSKLHKLVKELSMNVATDVGHISHVVERPSSSKITKRAQEKQFNWRHFLILLVLTFIAVAVCLPSVKQAFTLVGQDHVKNYSIRSVRQAKILPKLLCPMLIAGLRIINVILPPCTHFWRLLAPRSCDRIICIPPRA